MTRSRRVLAAVALGACACAAVAPADARATKTGAIRPHARAAAVLHLVYRGIRRRTSTGEPVVGGERAYDDQFTIVDRVTLTRGPLGNRRYDAMIFDPAGLVTESPAPVTERRSRTERAVRYGTLAARTIDAETTTIDIRSVRSNVYVTGGANMEMTTVAYGRPRVVFATGGPAQTFENWIARSIEVASSAYDRKTRIRDDGSLLENDAGISRTLRQDADGAAQYHIAQPGFFLYELAVDGTAGAERPATIHVVRTTQGRTVGPAPIVTESFSPPTWYPSGKLGPDTDVVASIGMRRLSPDCGAAAAAASAFETIELRSQTRITGDMDADTTTTFARGDLVLCAIDEKKHTEFEPTSGALEKMQTDTEVLYLAGAG